MEEDTDYELWTRWQMRRLWRGVAGMVVYAILIVISMIMFFYYTVNHNTLYIGFGAEADSGILMIGAIVLFSLLFISAFERLGKVFDYILEEVWDHREDT